MSDTDNDEDLKRAIALSLEQSPPTPSNCNPQVIDLTSDDEDDDLDAPVSTKQITSVDPQVQCKDKPNTAARERYQAPGDIDSGSNIKGPLILEHSLTRSAFLGLNRKQMEEERLLRVSLRKKGEERNAVSDESRKRKASISPPPLRRRDSRQVKRKLSASKAEPEVGEVKEAMVCNPTPRITKFSGQNDFLKSCIAQASPVSSSRQSHKQECETISRRKQYLTSIFLQKPAASPSSIWYSISQRCREEDLGLRLPSTRH
jgi:hypothetical protein